MKKIFMMVLGFLFIVSVSFAADVQKSGERSFTKSNDLSIDQSVTCTTDLATNFCSGTASRTYVDSQNIRFYVHFWVPTPYTSYYWIYLISDSSGTIKHSNLTNPSYLGTTSTQGYYSIYADKIISPGDYTLTSVLFDNAGNMAISQSHNFTAY